MKDTQYMKDENYKVAGAAIPIEFSDGTSYLVSPLSDKDIEELNEWVRSEYISMVRRSGASPEEMGVAFNEAAGIQWMSGVGSKMMASVNGMARLVYQGCLKKHPNISYEKLRELLFHPDNLEKTRQVFERLNGVDAKGKKGRPPKRKLSRKRKSTED